MMPLPIGVCGSWEPQANCCGHDSMLLSSRYDSCSCFQMLMLLYVVFSCEPCGGNDGDSREDDDADGVSICWWLMPSNMVF